MNFKVIKYFPEDNKRTWYLEDQDGDKWQLKEEDDQQGSWRDFTSWPSIYHGLMTRNSMNALTARTKFFRSANDAIMEWDKVQKIKQQLSPNALKTFEDLIDDL